VRITFLGVGALGSTAVVLCRSLGAELRLVDFDRVESKNLLAQVFVKQSLNKNKAQAMKLQLMNFWGIKSEAFGVRLTKDNDEELLSGSDLVVDCFDNHDSRMVASDYCREVEIPLLHAALSGDGSFGLVRWDEDFTPDREDAAGAATCEGGEHLPMIGLLGATLARTIQRFVVDGERDAYMVTLSGVTRT
jgi:molybdopterin/thiamine biosynthesis adenylyltransferase